MATVPVLQTGHVHGGHHKRSIEAVQSDRFMLFSALHADANGRIVDDIGIHVERLFLDGLRPMRWVVVDPMSFD